LLVSNDSFLLFYTVTASVFIINGVEFLSTVLSNPFKINYTT